MSLPEQEPPLTVAEVAERLRLSVRCVTGRCKLGTIPAYKEGGVWRIPRRAFETWQAAKENQVRRIFIAGVKPGGYASPRTVRKSGSQPGNVLSMTRAEFAMRSNSR